MRAERRVRDAQTDPTRHVHRAVTATRDRGDEMRSENTDL